MKVLLSLVSRYVICAAVATPLIVDSVGANAASTDAYPTRPLRLIIPNAPGSGVDTLGRIIANRLTQELGQQIVVDNRVGAGGIIGMETGRKAAPDGYTLINASTSTLAIAPLLQGKPPFDPLKDFDYVTQTAVTLGVVAVNTALPVKTMRELIQHATANKLNMASAGQGSQSHLAGIALMRAAKFSALHVPYKGGGTSELAVISGESHWILSPAPAIMSHVNAGHMRALGHTMPRKTPLLPTIPPIADTVSGFDYSGWQGFLVPKGVAKAHVTKLRNAIKKTLASADVKRAFATQATEIVTGGPEDFRKLVEGSVQHNRTLVKEVGLQ